MVYARKIAILAIKKKDTVWEIINVLIKDADYAALQDFVINAFQITMDNLYANGNPHYLPHS